MALAQQWRDLQADLPPDWSTAQLRLTVGDAAAIGRAAALLGPAQPVRPQSDVLRFASTRGGEAPGPDALTRLLAGLDRERIDGTLALLGADEAPSPAVEQTVTLADAWTAELAKLPSDWSDLYGEVDLLSSDYFDRASVLCVPMNPRRVSGREAFRFRCARRFGYGTSPGMVRRCLERCDAESLRGSVVVLRALSDTQPVATQGPVWLLDGCTF